MPKTVTSALKLASSNAQRLTHLAYIYSFRVGAPYKIRLRGMMEIGRHGTAPCIGLGVME